MKKRQTAFFSFLFALALLLGSVRASAVSGEEISREIFQGILGSKNVTSAQEWIDGELTENAGSISEWYVFALSQSGDYDFSSYQKALVSFLSSHQVYSATSRQKYALALAATGSQDPYILTVLHNATGRQGLMSWVFALHFYNNGYAVPEWSAEEIIDAILVSQLESGGFAVIGLSGDPDVTAMTIQALAPYAKTNEKVKACVEKALSFLSAVQLPDGDFAGMSKENLESTVQVLISLCELGIDPQSDPRFLKNGHSLLDAMLLYRLPDGSFSHLKNGEANETAIMQAFYASVALQRFYQNSPGLFSLDHAVPTIDPSSSAPDGTVVKPPEEPVQKNNSFSLPLYHKIIIVSALVLAAGATVFFLVFKKDRKKDLILVWAAALLFIFLPFFFRIRSKEEYFSEIETGEKKGIVMISIRCDTALANYDDLDPSLQSDEFVPENGEILPVTLLPLYEGDSVYSVLSRACRQNSIPFEVQGADENRFSTAYVQGIHYLYECSCGPLSGWMFRVNGMFPIVGSSDYYPLDGDVIEWVYTCSLGHDIGNIWKGEDA